MPRSDGYVNLRPRKAVDTDKPLTERMRATVSMTPEMKESVEQYMEATGHSFAGVCRMAIAEFLAKDSES